MVLCAVSINTVWTLQRIMTHADSEPGEHCTRLKTLFDVDFAPQDALSLGPIVF